MIEPGLTSERENMKKLRNRNQSTATIKSLWQQTVGKKGAVPIVMKTFKIPN